MPPRISAALFDRHIFIFIVLAVIMADYLSKIWAASGAIGIIKNTGFTFGIPLQSNLSLLAAISILALILILVFRLKKPRKLLFTEKIFLGLIIGGGLANIIERLDRGYITDFIKIYGAYVNIADIAIFLGIILIIINIKTGENAG